MEQNQTETRHFLTAKEFVAMVRRAPTGAQFMLCIRNAAPVLDPDGTGPTNRYFEQGLATYLDVSRNEAKRLGPRMLSPTLESRGARMPVKVVQRTAAQGINGKAQYLFWFGA